MGKIVFGERVGLRLAGLLVALGAMVANNDAAAAALPVVSGKVGTYSNCSFSQAGPVAYTFSLDINFDQVVDPNLAHRAILVYNYAIWQGKVMTGVRDNSPSFYFMMGNHTAHLALRRQDNTVPADLYVPDFGSKDATTLRVTLPAGKLLSLTQGVTGTSSVAIGIGAANVFWTNKAAGRQMLVQESSGIAYIPFVPGTGPCKVLSDPTNAPDWEARVDMTAPDWNLGELLPGELQTTRLDRTDQHLCFSLDALWGIKNMPGYFYGGSQSYSGIRYALQATSQNGQMGNTYQLRHTESPSDAVPYQLSLENTLSRKVTVLPNSSTATTYLLPSGQECFVPTFMTNTPKAARAGDYSDVLSFTVIAQP